MCKNRNYFFIMCTSNTLLFCKIWQIISILNTPDELKAMNTGAFICYIPYNKYYLLVRSMNTFIIPPLSNAIKIYNSDQRRKYITIFAVDYNHFASRNISNQHYDFK